MTDQEADVCPCPACQGKTLLEKGQVLYDVVIREVQALLLEHAGGNMCVEVLSTILGQVIDAAPEGLRTKLLVAALDELGAIGMTEAEIVALDRSIRLPKQKKKELVH